MTKDRIKEIRNYLDYIKEISIKHNTEHKTTHTHDIAVELLNEVVFLQEIIDKIHYFEE